MTYRGENVTISDAPNAGAVPDLLEAVGSNQLHGFGLTAINDTRDNSFLPTQGRYLEVSGEYVTGSFEYPPGCRSITAVSFCLGSVPTIQGGMS